MKVFVTGGTGYLGRSVVPALVRAGHEVTALARSDKSAELVTRLGGTPVRGTVTDPEVLREAAKAAGAAIHLAQDFDGDTPAIDRAAAQAMQEGAEVYVHSGGTWVYGDTAGIATETSPYNPPGIVAWRLDNEKEVTAKGGIVVMPGLVYGRGEGLIETFYASKDVVPYIGDGENHWDLVHVDDIADLYVRALNAAKGSVYIGVNEARPTARAVSEILAKGKGTRSITIEEAHREMGPIADAFALDQRLSSAKARDELGWRPRHTDPLNEL